MTVGRRPPGVMPVFPDNQVLGCRPDVGPVRCEHRIKAGYGLPRLGLPGSFACDASYAWPSVRARALRAKACMGPS